MRVASVGVLLFVIGLSHCGGRSIHENESPGGLGNVAGKSGVPVRPQPGGPALPEPDPPPLAQGGTFSAAGGAAGMMAGMPGAGGRGFVQSLPIEKIASQRNPYGFAFMDSYFLVPCYEVQGHDCVTVSSPVNCANDSAEFKYKGSFFIETFRLEGLPGRLYDIDLRVNGIASGKYYQGGSRRRGADFSDVNNPSGSDALHVGGEPIPSSYGVFMISVFGADYAGNAKEKSLQHFYLNSFPQSSGLESHQTVPIGFHFTIEGVAGDSVIEYYSQNSNCRAINNCGPGDNGSSCPAARNVPNEPGLAVPPMYAGHSTASMNVINYDQQPWHAQMFHVTVTGVRLR